MNTFQEQFSPEETSVTIKKILTLMKQREVTKEDLDSFMDFDLDRNESIIIGLVKYLDYTTKVLNSDSNWIEHLNLLKILVTYYGILDDEYALMFEKILDLTITRSAENPQETSHNFIKYLSERDGLYIACILRACQNKNKISFDYLVQILKKDSLKVISNQNDFEKLSSGLSTLLNGKEIYPVLFDYAIRTGEVALGRLIAPNIHFDQTTFNGKLKALLLSQDENTYPIIETFLQIMYVSLPIECANFSIDKIKIKKNIMSLLIAYQIIALDKNSLLNLRLVITCIYPLLTHLRARTKISKYNPSTYVPLIQDLLSTENLTFPALVGKVIKFLEVDILKKIYDSWMGGIPKKLTDMLDLTSCDLDTLDFLVGNIPKYKTEFNQNFQTLFDVHNKDSKRLIDILFKHNDTRDDIRSAKWEPDTINQIYERATEKFDRNDLVIPKLEYKHKFIGGYFITVNRVIADKPKDFQAFINCFPREDELITYPVVTKYLLKINHVDLFRHYFHIRLQLFWQDHSRLISQLLKLILEQKNHLFLKEFIKVLQANRHFIPMTSENNILCTDLQACIFLVYGIKVPTISKYTPTNDFDINNITAEMGIAAYFRIQIDIVREFNDCTNPFQIAIQFLRGYLKPEPTSLITYRSQLHNARKLIQFFEQQKDIIELNDACFNEIASMFRTLPNGKGAFAALLVFMLSPVFNAMAYAFIMQNNPKAALANLPLEFSSRLNVQSIEVFQKACIDNNFAMVQECMDKGGFDTKSYTAILETVGEKENPLELLQLLSPKLRELNININVAKFKNFSEDVAVFLLFEGIVFSYPEIVFHNNALSNLVNISQYIISALAFKPKTGFELAKLIVRSLLNLVPSSRSLSSYEARTQLTHLYNLFLQGYHERSINLPYINPHKVDFILQNSFTSFVTSPIFQELVIKLQVKLRKKKKLSLGELQEKSLDFDGIKFGFYCPQKFKNFISKINSNQLYFNNFDLNCLFQNFLPLEKKFEIMSLLLKTGKYDASIPLPMENIDPKFIITLFKNAKGNERAQAYLRATFVKNFERIHSNARTEEEKDLLVEYLLEGKDYELKTLTTTPSTLNRIYRIIFSSYGKPEDKPTHQGLTFNLKPGIFPENFTQFQELYTAYKMPLCLSVFQYFIKYDSYNLFTYYFSMKLNSKVSPNTSLLGMEEALLIDNLYLVDPDGFVASILKDILEARSHKCLQALVDALKVYSIDWVKLLGSALKDLSDIQMTIFFINASPDVLGSKYKIGSFPSMVKSFNTINPCIEIGIAAFIHVIKDTSPDFTKCTDWKDVAVALLEAYKKPSVGLFFTYDRNQLENAKTLIEYFNNSDERDLTEEGIDFMQNQLKGLKDFKTYSALLIFLISPALRIISAALINKHNPSIEIETMDKFDAAREVFEENSNSEEEVNTAITPKPYPKFDEL